MSIFDLPDISDEDWNSYQADEFRRMTQPHADALSFQQTIGPQVDSALATIQRINQMANPLPAAPPPPQMQTPMGAMPQVGQQGGLFSPPSQGALDPSNLSTMLRSYPDQSVGETAAASPPPFGLAGSPGGSLSSPDGSGSPTTGVMGPPSAHEPSFWSGVAPDKPNIFSWIGQEAQRGANELRAKGATQVPVVGGIMGGTAQGVANIFNTLGGSAQGVRQGDPWAAVGGPLQATVGEGGFGGIAKAVAQEYQVPNQIFKNVSPETPFVGGLNNPQEWVGFLAQAATPETALERGVLGLAGKGLGLAARSPAGRAIGEVTSPVVDQALSGVRAAGRGLRDLGGDVLDSFGRGAETAPTFGIARGDRGPQFHGSATPFGEVDPTKFADDSLYIPGYYTTSDPRIAETYTESVRGLGQDESETALPWTVNDVLGQNNRVREWINQMRARGTTPRAEAWLSELEQRLPTEPIARTDPSAPNYRYIVAKHAGQDPADLPYQMNDALDYDAYLEGAWNEATASSAGPGGRLLEDIHDSISRPIDSWAASDFFGQMREQVREPWTIGGPRPNIRKIDVPSSLHMLDIDNTVPAEELSLIRRRLDEADAGMGNGLDTFETELEVARDERVAGSIPKFAHTVSNREFIGEDVFRALFRVFEGDRGGIGLFLEDLGYDGVTHIGGTRRPLLDADGNPILHQVDIISPKSLPKIRNALSGTPGGIAARSMESPFFSPAATGKQAATDLALGAAGFVGGAATAPGDATWQERLERGAVAGSLAAGLGPMARAPRGLGGIARSLSRDETGALNLGILNPAEGYADDEWRALSRNERRRINYEQRRGEYARVAPRRAADAVGDYGAREAAEQTPPPPPHTSLAPQEAQQAAYEEAMSRMTERGLPEDEADETAWAVGREAADDEAERVSQESSRLYDEQPDTRPNDDPAGDGVTSQEEIDNLTDGVTPVLRQNPVVRERQNQFVGYQEGLPGMAGEHRASIPGQSYAPAYDAEGNYVGYGETVGGSSPEAVMHAVADRTGSAPVGTYVQKSLTDAGIDPVQMMNPDEAVEMPSWLKDAIGLGDQVLAKDQPEVREYAERVVSALREQFKLAHGTRSDAALEQAVAALRPFALDLARSADPGTGMTSDVLVALMHQGVEATTTPTYIAYDRLMRLVADGADEALIAAARKDYEARAAINNVYLMGLEAYASASGRALRANRPDVYGSAPFIPEVEGGSVDAGDVGRAKNFGKAEPASEARAVAREEWNTRQRALRRGEQVVDRGSDWNSPYWQRKRDLMQAADVKRSGRRQNGPLENEGLLWTDLFVRDDPSVPKGTPLTDDERLRWLFGLAELEVPKGAVMDALWKRMATINPDDTDAVLKFWADAAREGGARDTPYLAQGFSKSGKPLANPIYERARQGESPWEDGIKEAGKLADQHQQPWMKAGKLDTTLPRDKAIKVAYNALKKRLDDATEALAEAQRDGVSGDIKRYQQVVASAQKNMPKDEGGSLQGLYERIKAEYPPDFEQTRLPGERVAENVNVQSPEILTKKVELLNQLDEMSRGIRAVRGGLSIVTSNMLTSARMIEASAMESAVTAINKVYTQAVWRGDMDGARQIMSGYVMGAVPAFNNMLYAFKVGMGPMEAMDYLNDVAQKGGPAVRSTPLATELKNGVQAGWLAPMHRISRAMQEYFNTLIYYGELNRLAHVQVRDLTAGNAQARALGSASRGRIFAGDATRIAASTDPLTPGIWFHAPTEAMRSAALKEAMTVASGGPHSVLAKTLAGIKSNLENSKSGGGQALGLIANVLFPFVYGIDFTVRAGSKLAVGPVMYPVKAATAYARGETQAAGAYATNALVTTAADLFLIAQVLGGNLTGKGPSDPRERQALLEATDENGDPTWRPDSMRVPLPNGRHMWVAYGSLPIVGLTGALFANAYETFMYDGRADDNLAEKVAKVAAGTMGTWAEGTYFRDLMDLVSIFSEPQSAGTSMSRFGGGLVGRVVPAVFRQAAQAIDPNRKAPENALQELAQNVPGLRNLVPNQISPFTGGDVRMGWSPLSLVSPGSVYYGTNGVNPVATETARLNTAGYTVAPSQFSATQQGHGTTILGQRQTGAQVRGAQDVMADETQRRAAALLASPEYQRMSDAQKAANLDALFSRARQASDYDWSAGLTLTPQQQLTRAQSAVRRYDGPGLAGLTPSELSRRNEEIGQAKSLLARYVQVYGEDRGEIMLRRQNRQAWRDAVMYDDADEDLVWLRNRRAAQGLGLDPRLLAQPTLNEPSALPAPSLGIGQVGNLGRGGGIMPQLVQPPDYSFANRVPPSAR